MDEVSWNVYRDKIIVTISVKRGVTQCDVGMSSTFKTHPLFMYSTLMAHAHTVVHTSSKACFLHFFSHPYNYVAFNSLV